MLFDLAHLPYWIILGMGILLFLTVILGGIGDEDVDLDGDVDGDLLDMDLEAESDISPLMILHWLGFGRAPLILLLATDFSIFGIVGWLLNVVAAGVTGVIPQGWLGGLVFALSLVIALGSGGLIARPLGQVFAQFGEETSGDRLLGCDGTVSSADIPYNREQKIGQITVLDPARNRLTLPCALPDWAQVQPRYGETVMIIDRQASYYLVLAKDSIDQDQWFQQIKDT
ncbi:YqiJ family protein [Candidatus Synechococcus calcipolaris G9]|uniref:YqiJ family protein n=1 Tax=Candidatus Synechococcus calcipolaris G9 TaxID=1497997 RepID=A0ABT6EVJ9_9SYNE|nr:OB-fold-containig protein [Candidatus Synechococcus calcipolaris]MDG2989829.1 YqiJ family protein [Candidatus Synechococcus calcipolaris G9]